MRKTGSSRLRLDPGLLYEGLHQCHFTIFGHSIAAAFSRRSELHFTAQRRRHLDQTPFPTAQYPAQEKQGPNSSPPRIAQPSQPAASSQHCTNRTQPKQYNAVHYLLCITQPRQPFPKSSKKQKTKKLNQFRLACPKHAATRNPWKQYAHPF